MKELPILFSTPMVQANIDGRKRMTRRMTGLDNVNEDPDAIEFVRFQKYEKDGSYRAIFKHEDADGFGSVKCPYGQPGDLLWVRETHQKIKMDSGEYRLIYKTDPIIWGGKWKPSIHMPKDAARIWMQVEEISVERLQDISEEDMISEGLLIPTFPNGHPAYALGNKNSAVSFLPEECFSAPGPPPTKKQILFAFWAELWCKINGRESWDANPWVWVVKFKTLSTTGKPQMCYKTNEVCKYDCKGLCRESM